MITEVLIEKLIEAGINTLSNLFRINATVKAGGELSEQDRAFLKGQEAAESARFDANIAAALAKESPTDPAYLPPARGDL